MTRIIQILPDANEVYFAEAKFYPELEQWKALNLAQIKISAEDAVQIAEDAGGVAFRAEVGNECSIHTSIEAGEQYSNWRINYSSIDNRTRFEVTIDELTGKYKIIR